MGGGRWDSEGGGCGRRWGGGGGDGGMGVWALALAWVWVKEMEFVEVRVGARDVPGRGVSGRLEGVGLGGLGKGWRSLTRAFRLLSGVVGGGRGRRVGVWGVVDYLPPVVRCLLRRWGWWMGARSGAGRVWILFFWFRAPAGGGCGHLFIGEGGGGGSSWRPAGVGGGGGGGVLSVGGRALRAAAGGAGGGGAGLGRTHRVGGGGGAEVWLVTSRPQMTIGIVIRGASHPGWLGLCWGGGFTFSVFGCGGGAS